MYRGVSDFFSVLPDHKNFVGPIIAKCIDDVDQDGDGYTPNEGDCADADKTIHPGAEDLCNDEIDQDCNPDTCQVRVWYADRDNDGYGDASDTTTRTQCPDHYVANSLDCNDADGNISPNAVEQCNGIDDNCNGIKDERCAWSKVFDGGGEDRPLSIIQTRDSGYLIAENISSNSVPDATVLMKIDEIGIEQWTLKLNAGEDNYGTINDIIQSIDGGFIVTGQKNGAMWLMKIDERGEEILFNEVFLGGSGTCVLQIAEGGYVIAGTGFDGTGGYGAILIETDNDGEQTRYWIFQEDHPDPNIPHPSMNINSVIQTDDSGYLLAGTINYGTTYSNMLFGNRIYLVKISTEGTESWRRTIEDVGGITKAVFQSDDGGFVLGSHPMQYSQEMNIIKTDSQGRYQWNRAIVATGNGVNFSSMVQVDDGGYVIAGYDDSDEMEVDPDTWIIKTSKDFDIEWRKTFGGDSDDLAKDVVSSIDGGYAVLVETNSYGSGNHDFWVIKTDVNGNAPLPPNP